MTSPYSTEVKTYHRVKYILFFVGLILDVVGLLFIFYSGLTFTIQNIATQFSNNFFIANGIYFFLFCLILYVINFPIDIFLGFIWEHKFKLSNQNFSDWMYDEVKRSSLGFLIMLVLVEVIYILLRIVSNSWWLWAGGFWLFLTFILAKLTPSLIIPIFFKYSKIEDGLKERILALAKKCKFSIANVFSINLSAKTKKANAFFCGFGKNKRVVLSDTLIKDFSPEEIEIVVAHELGHYKNKDMFKLLFINTGVILVGFYLINLFLNYSLKKYSLNGIDDITLMPLLALTFMFFGFITTPALNAYSRKLERAADKFSLDITKSPENFISMISKLGKMNLAEKEPNPIIEILFYDHPPIEKRIAFAKAYKITPNAKRKGR